MTGTEDYISPIKDASKMSIPLQNWRLAISGFIVEFGDCLSDHLSYIEVTQNYRLKTKGTS
jgi:hypothetical protein